jgi:hypothetical protein
LIQYSTFFKIICYSFHSNTQSYQIVGQNVEEAFLFPFFLKKLTSHFSAHNLLMTWPGLDLAFLDIPTQLGESVLGGLGPASTGKPWPDPRTSTKPLHRRRCHHLRRHRSLLAMTTRIAPGVGANLLGQHSAERNQDATTYVGNLDPQVRVPHLRPPSFPLLLLPFVQPFSSLTHGETILAFVLQ